MELINSKCTYCSKAATTKRGFGPNPVLLCQECAWEWDLQAEEYKEEKNT